MPAPTAVALFLPHAARFVSHTPSEYFRFPLYCELPRCNVLLSPSILFYYILHCFVFPAFVCARVLSFEKVSSVFALCASRISRAHPTVQPAATAQVAAFLFFFFLYSYGGCTLFILPPCHIAVLTLWTKEKTTATFYGPTKNDNNGIAGAQKTIAL